MWYYRDKEFTAEMIGDSIGFVYIITNKNNDMKYIGKKFFWSTRKLPPLKGKSRKRTKIVESDWRDYHGSSEEVKRLLVEQGSDIFEREILHLCKSKGELSYIELLEQIERRVLLDDTYYNGIINVRINKSHLKSLR